jgi:hypothetical protein
MHEGLQIDSVTEARAARGGMCAPAVQIGALPGVTQSTTGLASGLLETMREIGGAVGVAVVSTVLVSEVGEIAGAADSTVREPALVVRLSL